jgi:hypothetical protein
MAYLFSPPVVNYGPAGGNWLFSRYTLSHGMTVYKIGNTWYEEEYPSQDDLNTASAIYVGGHEYYVTEAEKNDLEDADYEVVNVP